VGHIPFVALPIVGVVSYRSQRAEHVHA